MNISALTAAVESTAPANNKPDYIAIALVAVLAVIVIIMVIRKHIMLKKAAKIRSVEVIKEAAPVAVPGAPAPAAPGSAGKIKIHDVDPKTAAMLMAIVADKTGKPLNELRFISIKEVK